jgi:hypothetical protein
MGVWVCLFVEARDQAHQAAGAGKIVKPVAPILPDLTLRGLRTNDETTSHVCGVSEHHLIKRTHACLASNVLPC